MTNNVRIRVLFFGVSREAVGRAEELLDLPGAPLAGDVLNHYAAQSPQLRDMAGALMLAVNAEFARAATRLREGDEVALLPPVSGGAGGWIRSQETAEGHIFALTRDPIDAGALIAKLLRGKDGAVLTFEGRVRDNSNGRATRYLEYEAYEPLAVATMAEIGRYLATIYGIDRVAMVHRLGRLEIGETSVVVVVTAAHRKAAFAACLEGINRLKKRVPIWKKEYFADGEVWVEGDWNSSDLQ